MVHARRAAEAIHEFPMPSSRFDTETPRVWSGQCSGIADAAAGTGAGIDEAFMFGVGGAGSLFHIESAARTRIDQLPRLQLVQRRFVPAQPLGLDDGALVPVQAEPVQILRGLVRRTRFD